MAYLFRSADAEDIDSVFALFEKRVRWMNEEGIQQWNVTDYLNVYPKSYYRRQQAIGNLYVLADGGAAGAVVLLNEDERWKDKGDASAVYIHNLVTDPAVKGLGRLLLAQVEKMAVQQGKRCIRLDCAADNGFLNSYYGTMGYEAAGECRDGIYVGIRREKKL